MDISALESMNVDVLIAILVFFALLSFVLFSIVIRLTRSIDKLRSVIEDKCKNCKVLKSLNNRTPSNNIKKEDEKNVEEEKDPIMELEKLQMGM